MAGSDRGQSFLEELKRRQVVRVAVVYLGAGFVVLEGADLMGEAFRLPQVFLTAVGVLVVLGFPLAVALAWAFEVTPEGVKRTEETLPRPESSDQQGSKVSESPSWISLQTMVVAVSLVFVGILLAWGLRRLPDAVDAAVEAPPAARRLAITLPESSRLAFIGSAPLGVGRTALDLSPDGRFLVYAGIASGGGTQLYLRSLDRFEVRPLPGTEGAYAPFFSPDSRWIGFFAEDQLKKVTVLGGNAVAIADATNSYGGAWWTPDRILFSSHEGTRLFWVPASGGTPRELELRHEMAGQSVFITSRPAVLPGGKHFLFTDLWNQNFAYSFESGVTAPLLRLGSSLRFTGEGTLLFTRGSDLLSVAFDPEELAVVSEPALVAEGVRVEGFGQAQFSVDAEGLLAYAPGAHVMEGSLSIVDRDGNTEPLPFPEGIFSPPAFSPSGDSFAVGILEVTWDVWIFDLEKGTRRRLTRDGNNQVPIWSPDGERIFFMSDRGDSGTYDIYSIPASGARRPTPVIEDSGFFFPYSVSADGTLLLAKAAEGPTDLYLLPPDRDAKAALVPLAAQPGVGEGLGRLSVNGRWVAYTSDETGRYEVYVAPTSGQADRVQISVEGGEEAAWSPSGDRVFFRNGTTLMAVPIEVEGPAIRAGSPTATFDDPAWVNLIGHSYDVAPDGNGFLIVRSEQEAMTSEIRVVEGPLASRGPAPR